MVRKRTSDNSGIIYYYLVLELFWSILQFLPSVQEEQKASSETGADVVGDVDDGGSKNSRNPAVLCKSQLLSSQITSLSSCNSTIRDKCSNLAKVKSMYGEVRLRRRCSVAIITF